MIDCFRKFLYLRYAYHVGSFIALLFYTSPSIAQNTNPKNIKKIELQKLDSLGRYHWQIAEYSQALLYYNKAFSLASQINDAKWQSRILNYLGIIYENKGDFDKSLNYHFLALRNREKRGDLKEIAVSFVNIGITYSSSGEIQKGLTYYLKCLKVNETLKDLQLDAHAHYHICTSYRRLKDYEKAGSYAQKALKLATQIKEISIIMDAQNALGLIAHTKKDFSKAQNYYEIVCNLAIKEQDWLVLTNTLQHLAENDLARQDYPKALENTNKSLDLAKKHGLKAEEKNAYQTLATIYAQQGNYQQAYQSYEQFNILKDTLFSLQKSKQIEELTTQYETEKKEQQIQLLIKDKKLTQSILLRQRFLGYLLILGIVFMLTIVGFGFWSYRSRQKLLEQELMIQKQNEKIAQEQHAKLEEQILLEESLNKMKQERLEEQIAHKERELASTTMHIFQKNEMLNRLQEKLNDLDSHTRILIKPLFQEIQHNLDLDEDWANFQLHFSQVHPYFFSQLQNDFSSLTQNELKLLAYIRMKLSNKEIAHILHISPKSMEMSRYRLKKKLNLAADVNLDDWIGKY